VTTAGLAALLPLPVAVPLAGAAICPLVSRIWNRLAVVVMLVCLAASTTILVLMAPHVLGGSMLVHYMGHWDPVDHHYALGIAFGADAWGTSYALLVGVGGMALAAFAMSELSGLGKKETGWFSCLFLALLGALIGAGLTADLFNLFVWFEVAALASYSLTAFFLERPIALEASFKILVLTNLASFAIFVGAALLYADHGALNMGQLQLALSRHLERPDLVALTLLVGGFATKAGLVPFHGWLPDAHTAAPGSVSALFSGLMVAMGLTAIGRIVFEVYWPIAGKPLLGLLMLVGLVSALGGAVFALLQDDLKRLLAYDTISQMGVLAVGLATRSATGLAGTAYHLWSHALFKALLFLCAGALVHNTGETHLSRLGGLARRYPLLAIAFCVGVASIAGIPPFAGYVSLGLIHDALRAKQEWGPLVLMYVAQIVTVAALGKAAWQAFFRRRDEPHERDAPLRPGMIVGLALLAGACVGFGVLPGAVLGHLVDPAAAALLHPMGYGASVLLRPRHIGTVAVSFDYVSPVDLLGVAGTVLLAVPLARLAMRRGSDERVQAALRRVQTGSVNDYAGYLVAGLVVVAAVLLV
jgi:multicomponent Na+:H+ antiporter subunit D